MSRYSYVHTQIWKDKKFRALSESSKLLYIAMLTAPNSNMIGLYEWPVAYAIHDLGEGWTEQKFFECVNEIEAQGMGYYDRDNEIVFIPNFLKDNQLNTIKQIIGGGNYFNKLPSTYLFVKFLSAWTTFIDTPLKIRLTGREDESAQKSLKTAEKILTNIKDRAAEFNSSSIDSNSNEYATTIDTPIDSLSIIPGHVHGHGHVHGQKDKDSSVSADADTLELEAADNELLSGTQVVATQEKTGCEVELTDTKAPPCTITLKELLSLWNEILTPLNFPQALKATPAREKAFKARLNALKERCSADWWRGILNKLAASNFMLESAKNKANWLTLDWLLNENNLVKICEGKYDNRPKSTQEPPYSFDEALSRLNQHKPPTFDEAMRRYGFGFNGTNSEVIDVTAQVRGIA
ncbi:MAG: hypothetical protein IJ576_09915 [Synergistaceae bacterium]|nr:hypothetical protein [Synergistaceae bacterium]MBR1602849.1 hypothetical protein [Synergistaceae bacterium]